jgi:hypothetical protein
MTTRIAFTYICHSPLQRILALSELGSFCPLISVVRFGRFLPFLRPIFILPGRSYYSSRFFKNNFQKKSGNVQSQTLKRITVKERMVEQGPGSAPTNTQHSRGHHIVLFTSYEGTDSACVERIETAHFTFISITGTSFVVSVFTLKRIISTGTC